MSYCSTIITATIVHVYTVVVATMYNSFRSWQMPGPWGILKQQMTCIKSLKLPGIALGWGKGKGGRWVGGLGNRGRGAGWAVQELTDASASVIRIRII